MSVMDDTIEQIVKAAKEAVKCYGGDDQYMILEKEERIESRGYTCEYCHGQGGFLGDRSSPNDSEWKICPVCEGSGKMDAEVTIKWKPNKRDKAK